MKLSLFTPTNNPTYLPELYSSLLVQSHKDWEWLLVPNETVTTEDIPADIRRDRRVRIVGFQAKNIGALKRFACDNCKGDAFLEMDHDDVLTVGALARINAAFEDGAGFVHSDDACFNNDAKLTPHVYDAEHGWETYPIRVYGREFLATRSFPVDARSLCEIGFAPDHIRSWRRDTYYKSGGHDRELLVADDHDLLCRTYLTGCKFTHTGHCDYLYRYHPSNSVKRYYDQIWDQQAKNRDKYLWKLVDEWLRRTTGLYVNYSERRNVPTLRHRLPYEDGTVSAIRCFDTLQYLTYEEAATLLAEFARILIPGGWLGLRIPSTRGDAAFMPDFKSFWNSATLKCLTHRETQETGWQASPGQFFSVRMWESTTKHGAHVYADLQVIKDGYRLPGKRRI